ncbi:MAG: diguanylate cyclase, partial [Bacillota bacterium]|nr:diguanylate cyclase [Bacillota bacterium]
QNISSPVAFSQLEDNWKFFSDSKKIYTKIRYIDVSGNEKVKIEYFPNGSVSIKPQELKNKANKSYYKNLSKLLKDQIYISRLELDFDDGTLERQPVIRMSMPVFENGARMGSVVISYNANYLFDDLRNTALTSYGDIYLLNSSGYWLYNDRNGENEWGFMYKGREYLTFANAYPSEWSRIIESGKGSIEDKNGLFTFFDVKPYYKENNYGKTSVLSGEDEWLLASVVSSSSKNGIVFNKNLFDIMLLTLDKQKIFLLVVLAFSVSTAIFWLAYRRSERKIRKFSLDILTEVYDRRAGFEQLRKAYKTAYKKLLKLSVCFIDVNGLKKVNDSMGHKAGDELIKSIIQVIRNNLRKSDFIIRIGGDEFLIVLEGVGSEEAEKIWQRICGDYKKINHTEEEQFSFPVSHGIEEFKFTPNESVEKIINEADEKMYKEKRKINRTL